MSAELVQFWAKTDGEAPEPKLDQAAELQREWETERGQVWADRAASAGVR